MGNPAQAILSIGGAAIGFFITGGNPAGAAWGYNLETIRGAATFPTAAAQEGAGDPQPPAGAEGQAGRDA